MHYKHVPHANGSMVTVVGGTPGLKMKATVKITLSLLYIASRVYAFSLH